jgi:hypothetical protein
MRRPVDQQGEGGGVFIPCKGIRRVLRKVREKSWVTNVKESDMKIWPLETSGPLEACRCRRGRHNATAGHQNGFFGPSLSGL